MPYAGYLILDFDGTIADTLEMALAVFNRVAPEYDLQPVGDRERELFRTKKPQELIRDFDISKLKLLTLTLRIRKEMSRHIPEMKLFDGLDMALREIRDAGYGLGSSPPTPSKMSGSLLTSTILPTCLISYTAAKVSSGRIRS